MRKTQALRIGLTGGIGAGKSLASECLRRLGVCVLDADAAARRVVEKGEPALDALVERYGEGLLLPSGLLNRSALAEIIFHAEEERAAVNALLHPAIISRMQEEEAIYRKDHPELPVVWDVPLLIETGMQERMDRVWLVVAEDALRLKRIMLRDTCSKEQALFRIKSQMPQEEKLRYADVCLYNNASKKVFRQQVHACYKALMEEG